MQNSCEFKGRASGYLTGYLEIEVKFAAAGSLYRRVVWIGHSLVKPGVRLYREWANIMKSESGQWYSSPMVYVGD